MEQRSMDNRAWKPNCAGELHVDVDLKTVEPYAYARMEHLERIVLTEGLLRIEEGAFMDCKNLSDVKIPQTVQYIGKNAFAGCVSLCQVELPAGLRMIDNGAFCGSGLTEIRLSAVTVVGAQAFEDCMSLHSAEIGAKHIGKRSFANCAKLSNVQLHRGLMTVGEEAFRDCCALGAVCVPFGVCEFGNLSFAGIPALDVQIPAYLKESVENHRAFRPVFGEEEYYIFENSAKLRYGEGGV